METKKPRRQKKRISTVENWIKKETDHKLNALENASRHFDKLDALTVNTLEGIYGQESSFGSKRGKRGIAGPAGDFQLERRIGRKMGPKVSPKNDQRFDVDNASAAAAKYLKTLDRTFSKKTTLAKGIETVSIKNMEERKKFTVGAYNAGEGRIAKAQDIAKQAGKDSTKGDDVKNSEIPRHFCCTFHS
jgi:membrane-bound lytic murein transglycosylase MltF